MATITVTLPQSLQSFVERKVADRRLPNAAEYLVELVREAEAHEIDDELEHDLLQGLDSEAHVFDEAFRARLDAEVEEILRDSTGGTAA